MLFTSWVFALFFICTASFYWLTGKKHRDLVLILAGMVFYGYAALEQMPVILGLTVITFYLGLIIDRYKHKKKTITSKTVMITGVSVLVLALSYYKYSPLLVRTWNGFAADTGWPALPVPKVLAPLAISFLVFQFIHYLADKYRGTIHDNSFRHFLLYALFFPALVAGPIKRYGEFAPQIQGVRFSFDNFGIGCSRVIIGLAKKIILADTFAAWGDKLLNPQMNSGLVLLIAVYAYTLKIYFDFSGYSDIAIGTARILGYELPENFNWPYLAANISDFWRRWHMSLSAWIRDYLYIPLGGSRVSNTRYIMNALISMGLSGLWHGANWTFLLWGLWHGAALGFYGIYRRSGLFSGFRARWFWKLAGWFVTFNFISFGWVLFAAKSFADALLIFTRIISIR